MAKSPADAGSFRRLAILGGGSWGTALAISLSTKFEVVSLWVRNAEAAAEIGALRENRRYLPGAVLPKNIEVTSDAARGLAQAEMVLVVLPSQHVRRVLADVSSHICRDAVMVSASKGMEDATFCRMTQLVAEMVKPARPVAALSGPTFAREIARGEPAALVVACEQEALAHLVQRTLATPALRLYSSTDVIGVEMGAALKNVIAIGAGICHGLGLGSNSVAALITRGLAEITRLAIDMGGKPRTLSGLAGLGDLVLTATGDLSRNRAVGVELGRGRTLADILARMTMVAEGVETCRAAYHLAQSRGVEMPIVGKMYEVLYEGKAPREAIRQLMDRPLTVE